MPKSKEPSKERIFRNVGDCIEGDQILISCRTPSKWKVYRRTKQDHASYCIAKKGARAIIEKTFTNIKSK